VSANTTGSGTRTLSVTDTSAMDKTLVNASTITPNLSVTATGTGKIIFSGAQGFTNFTVNAPKSLQFLAGATVTIAGTITMVGSSGNLSTIISSAAGTAATISKASGTVSCDYLSLKDSTATGGASFFAGDHSTNVSGNTGWIFTHPTFTVGQALETDSSQAFSHRRALTLGQPIETDLATSMGRGRTYAIAQPIETDLATSVSIRRGVTLAQPGESDSA